MAQDLDKLLPEVMTFAPRCPEPLALRHLRQAAIEFCQRTRAWRADDEFTVSTPDCEGVCTLQDAVLFEIKSARLGETDLTPVTEAWLDSEYPGWKERDESTPRYVTQLSANTVTLYPRGSGLLKLRLVLQPSRQADTLPDFLVDQHGELLGKGAAGRVLTTGNVEWANPNLGAALLNEFQARLDTEAYRAAKGQQGARLRTRPNYF